jgi:hypothetical protein
VLVCRAAVQPYVLVYRLNVLRGTGICKGEKRDSEFARKIAALATTYDGAGKRESHIAYGGAGKRHVRWSVETEVLKLATAMVVGL